MKQVDMLVGDIYGDRDYTAIGLSASTIASSFGGVVSRGLDLAQCDPADIAMALCRMVRLLSSAVLLCRHITPPHKQGTYLCDYK